MEQLEAQRVENMGIWRDVVLKENYDPFHRWLGAMDSIMGTLESNTYLIGDLLTRRGVPIPDGTLTLLTNAHRAPSALATAVTAAKAAWPDIARRAVSIADAAYSKRRAHDATVVYNRAVKNKMEPMDLHPFAMAVGYAHAYAPNAIGPYAEELAGPGRVAMQACEERTLKHEQEEMEKVRKERAEREPPGPAKKPRGPDPGAESSAFGGANGEMDFS
jgi:hypothetical protein